MLLCIIRHTSLLSKSGRCGISLTCKNKKKLEPHEIEKKVYKSTSTALLDKNK